MHAHGAHGGGTGFALGMSAAQPGLGGSGAADRVADLALALMV